MDKFECHILNGVNHVVNSYWQIDELTTTIYGGQGGRGGALHGLYNHVTPALPHVVNIFFSPQDHLLHIMLQPRRL